MPGIAGIVSKRPPHENRTRLRVMIDRMRHEPRYNSGVYSDDSLGLYAGWVCHKDSFSDCMPVMNERGDRVLIFFGENFADDGFFHRLGQRGRTFDRHDARYLIHQYEEEGDEFFQNLNGWFCGLLIDHPGRKAILFNDRYGMQRIYYRETGDEFYFASEAKALLAIDPELRRIDMQGLAEFFNCGCALRNRTLFANVSLLPGGSSWTFHGSAKAKKAFYFTPDAWEHRPVLDDASFYPALRDKFSQILPRYFRSKNGIALSLTGGLDSRMVLAFRDGEPGTLPCYTFAGMYRDSLDVLVSGKVAHACRQPHYTLRLDADFLTGFRHYAEKAVYISDGGLQVTHSPELYVNRLAGEIAPIRMTGDFGSEVLRSVRAFKASPPEGSLMSHDFRKYVQKAGDTFNRLSKGNTLSFSLFRQIPWNEYGFLAVQQSQLTLRTPFMDNDLVGLMYQAPPSTRLSNDLSLRLIADGNPALGRIETDRGVGGNRFPLSLFTALLYGFLFKMEYYCNAGMPQWLAAPDRLLRTLRWERLFLGRHKFHHFRTWFRDELAGYLKEVLLDDRTVRRPYLNRGFVERMVHDHIQGRRNYTNEITKVLTSELVHRLLIEQD